MKTKLLLLQAIRWVISLTQLNNTFLHGAIVIKNENYLVILDLYDEAFNTFVIYIIRVKGCKLIIVICLKTVSVFPLFEP